jgi:small-conductance mechanosensitive channel
MFWFVRQMLTEHPWLKQFSEIVLLICAAGVLGSTARRWLRRWAEPSNRAVHHSLTLLLNRAIPPVLVLMVVALSLHLFPLSGKAMAVIDRILYVAVLGVLLYYASRLVHVLLNRWLEGSPGRRAIREPIQFVTKVVFAVFGTMILLENLGVRLTAVWTTLGIGSVAVALALQDTLSNFFAGVYLRIDRPVRLDDYIKLESGEEGFVVQHGWRSTRIRNLQNNVVVVPNAKLASTIVTNYSLPESQMALLIPINVSYNSDPDQVEQILVQEATRAAKEIPGLLADPAPLVRFIPGFGDFSLNFTLICRVQSFTDQYLAQHELRKRILRRFREEEIEMPFPQRDVRVHLMGAQGVEMARSSEEMHPGRRAHGH